MIFPRLLLAVFVAAAAAALAAEPPPAAVTLKTAPDGAGTIQFKAGDQTALVFNFGPDVDLPHFFPVNSPSGKSITVQRTEPYPHHRSFWFADTVRLKGQRRASFYNGWYTRVDTNKTTGPFKDTIRVLPDTFKVVPGPGGSQVATWKQVWEMDLGKTAVLDESREVRFVPLGQGEYFLDLKFTVTAGHGDVAFESDAVHYAWPFIRMSSDFNTNSGALLTSSTGAKGQAETNLKPAEWMDFSKPAEGLAMFSHPSNPGPHSWLTRDYGCIGPRRVDAQSGKPFTLKQGESISTRCGVLVHTGDVQAGKVAERFRAYCDGKL
jgi:hypothetical protein